MRITPETIRRLPQQDKLLHYDEVGKIIGKLKDQGAEVLLAQGVFDIVHRGHVGYLRAARQISPSKGIVVVGIENDLSVQTNKGVRRPINTEAERADVLTEFESADLVFVYPDTPNYNNPDDFIDRYQRVGPSAVVVPTWDPHMRLKEYQATIAGTTIATVVYQHHNSTTRMLREVGYEE